MEGHIVKSYELVYIVRPDITDQDLGTVRADVKNRIAALDGVVEKEDAWGKRQLAFEIKDFTEGHYTLVTIQLPPEEGPKKLREQLKIDERIIRYMLTVKERRTPPVERKAPS
jgi:small subunit ribosomal protein S6